MDYKEVGNVGGIPIRVPVKSYRTCTVCGTDCQPDQGFSSDEIGVRIGFVCPEHGINSIVNPFEGEK